MNLDEMMPPELALAEPPFDDRYLEAFLEDPDAVRAADPGAAGPVDRWRVESDDQAEWALRKLSIAEADVEVRRQQAEEWKARIDAWHVEVTAGARHTVEFMRGRLEDYALRVREAGGPATIKLPAGEVKTSVRQPSVTVEDDDGLARYLDAMLGAPTHAGTDAEAVVWAAWQMAWSAACAGMDEPLEVVKRTPKVYVGPLRKLVAVGEVSEGVWARSTLACGHHVDQQAPDLYDPDVPSRGDMLPCLACPLDLLDQAPPFVAVEVTIVEERFRQVVVGPDGSEVPGAGVDPGGVNVTVKAR